MAQGTRCLHAIRNYIEEYDVEISTCNWHNQQVTIAYLMFTWPLMTSLQHIKELPDPTCSVLCRRISYITKNNYVCLIMLSTKSYEILIPLLEYKLAKYNVGANISFLVKKTIC